MANISSINGNPIVVGASGISDGAVTSAKLASNAVSTAKIANGAVTLAKLGSDVEIEPTDGSITTAKLADGAVTDAKLAQTGGVLSSVANLTKGEYYPYNYNYLTDANTTLENTKINSSGAIGAEGSGNYVVIRVPVKSGESYQLTRPYSGQYYQIALQGGSSYSASGDYTYGQTIADHVSIPTTQPFTVPDGVKWAYLVITTGSWNDYKNIMTLQRISAFHPNPTYPASSTKSSAYLGPIVDGFKDDIDPMQHDVSELTRRLDASNYTGYDVVDAGDFEIGNIAGTTGANSTNNSCVRMKAIRHAEYDMTFECPDTYRMGFYFYQQDDTYIPDALAAEKVRYTVQKGSYFRMRVQAYPADVSVTANVATYCAAIGIDTKCVDDAFDSGDIIRLNGDKEYIVANMSRPPAGQTNPTLTPLEFIHFSDIHTYADNWSRLVEYMDFNQNYVEFAIHTGDYCGSYQYNYVDLYGVAKPKNSYILNVVGNHDWRLDNEVMADRHATHDKLFNDTTGWDVTFGSEQDAMYYYKDFTTSGIRLVVIDQYYWDSTESAWLDTVLESATDNDLAVVTAAHTQTGPITQLDCTFGRIDDFSQIEVATSAFATNILAFINAGGTHVCHLCGHWHHDEIGRDANGILNIVVEAASSNPNDSWRDTLRVNNLRSKDAFNVMAINVETGTFGIVRIGNSADHYGRNKNGLVYDYVNDKILANY